MRRELKRLAITLGVVGAIPSGAYIGWNWVDFAHSHGGLWVFMVPFAAVAVFCVWKVVGNEMEMRSAERNRDEAGE